jgi:hypothetical protein
VASQVDIANAALVKLGAERITNLSDPGAEPLEGAWDRLRDAELRSHPWKFAIRRGEFAPLTEVPAWGAGYQYQLPADYLRLVAIADDWWWDDELGPPWRIEGQRILTDMGSPLRLRWLSRVTETPRFDPLFVEALACRIALDLCVKVTGSASLKQTLRQDHMLALRDAYRVDAIERSPEPMRDTSWITGRV